MTIDSSLDHASASRPADLPAQMGPPTARPTESPLTPLLRRLHFYAGIFVAPFLLVSALTGLLYTIVPQLNSLAYGDQLSVPSVGAQRLPVADQVEAAQQTVPDGMVTSVLLPESEKATTQIAFAVEGLIDRQRTVYVDPYTGEVQGSLLTSGGATPIDTWIGDLHSDLHLGALGRNYSELSASWLGVLVLGGIALWIGKQRRAKAGRLRGALVPDLKAQPGVRKSRSIHAVTGVWITLGLLFLSITGLTWSRYTGAHVGDALTALNARTPVLDTTLPGVAPAAEGGEHAEHGGSGMSMDVDLSPIDTVLSAARGYGLDGPLSVTPPMAEGTAWTVAEKDTTWPLHLDRVAVSSTGEITADSPWSERPLLAKLTSLGIYAHMALLFGPLNQVALAAVALGLIVMIVLGYRMWWQRRPTGGARRAPVGPAAHRGTWRAVAPWKLAVIAAVALLAGRAIPLLGATLLGFLVLDAILGARTRPRREPAESS